MKETGQITEVLEDGVTVMFDSSSGCASCGLNHCCQSTGTGKRSIKIHLQGHPYQKGDYVEIETRARSMLTAAFLVFILPLILAFTAYGLVDKYTQNQSLSLVGFFAAFILTEGIVALFDRIWGKSKFFEPRILDKI